MALESVNEILDFAIKNEIEAAEFYTGLAAKVDKPWMKKAFEEFAREERGHRAKLEGVKAGGTLGAAPGKVLDLAISDYLIDVEPSPDMSYQEALIVAMKAEKAAFKLYCDLAAGTTDAQLKGLLETLAYEEAKHKLRFEIEYDDTFQADN